MTELKRLLRENPTVVAGVVRQLLLAGVALGLKLDGAQIVAIMVAVESVLTAINWALVTPTVKADEQAQDAADHARAKAIVEGAMSDRPTAEEWASIQELRAERDRLRRQA